MYHRVVAVPEQLDDVVVLDELELGGDEGLEVGRGRGALHRRAPQHGRRREGDHALADQAHVLRGLGVQRMRAAEDEDLLRLPRAPIGVE